MLVKFTDYELCEIFLKHDFTEFFNIKIFNIIAIPNISKTGEWGVWLWVQFPFK